MEWIHHLKVQDWLILAGILLILEMILPGIFLMWIGLAAAGVALMMQLFNIGWQGQLFSFALFSVLSVLFNLFLIKKSQQNSPVLNQRGQQYIGRIFVLEEPIINGFGKIRVDDTLWKVSGPDCPQGHRVKVIALDGIVLQVEPVN